MNTIIFHYCVYYFLVTYFPETSVKLILELSVRSYIKTSGTRHLGLIKHGQHDNSIMWNKNFEATS